MYSNNTTKNLDLKEKCQTYMAEQDLPINEQIIADGKIHRYSSDSKKNKPDEWYIAHEKCTSQGNQYLTCTFGSWSEGSKYEYKSFDTKNEFDEHEKNELKQALQKQCLQVEQIRQSSYNDVAAEVKKI